MGGGAERDLLQQVLDETRQSFLESFPAQWARLSSLVDEVHAQGLAAGPVADLTHAAHRMTGLAGTIGFPSVSVQARSLEDLIASAASSGLFETSNARAVVASIQVAFAEDVAQPPAWALPAAAPPQGATILLAEDEDDQRAIVTACLESAGYTAISVNSGDLVIPAARAHQPDLILLDVAMPRLDGYSACRLLKADADVADIPVIFMTTGANVDDRLTGLTLGADEFLAKPVDMRELILRIRLLLNRRRSQTRDPRDETLGSRLLAYDAFVAAARDCLAAPPVALAVIRVDPGQREAAAAVLADEVRRRDVMGSHGPARLLVLMPEMRPDVAVGRLELMVDLLTARGLTGICAGVAASSDGRTVEALIAEADEALAEARYLGIRAAVWVERRERPAAVAAVRTVVVAEDDPDVIRIIDAQIRAAGFIAVMAFDGEQAVAAVLSHVPDVLVLDLMMPKLNGFDVLMRLRDSAVTRPRIIVLTGRGREQDVMRAFELGADDYMTKPFNPQELMARIARLLK